MYSEVASSASPELVHWHDDMPTHLMSIAREDIKHATSDALRELKELIVSAEHSIEDICTHFGIHDFSHNLGNKDLTGATLALYSDGHLEIRRAGAKYATSFPVTQIA